MEGLLLTLAGRHLRVLFVLGSLGLRAGGRASARSSGFGLGLGLRLGLALDAALLRLELRLQTQSASRRGRTCAKERTSYVLKNSGISWPRCPKAARKAEVET
jgi:hypothetical protein